MSVGVARWSRGVAGIVWLAGCQDASSEPELDLPACERTTGAPIAFVIEGELTRLPEVEAGCETITAIVSPGAEVGGEGEVLIAAQECPGGFLESRDGGCTWAPIGSSIAGARLVPSSDGRAYAWGDHEVGRVGDGVAQPAVTFEHASPLRLVGLAAEGERVVVLNSAGAVHRSIDGGWEWERLATLSAAPSWSALVGDPTSVSNLVAISDGGGKVAHSQDAGATWRLAETPWTALDGVLPAIAPGGDVVWIVTASAVYRSTDGGATFALASGAEGGPPILGMPPSQAIAHPGNRDVVLFMTPSALAAYDASTDEVSVIDVDLAAFDPEPTDDHGVELRSFTVTTRAPHRLVVGFSLFPL